MDRREQLRRLIDEYEERFEKRKQKRLLLTLFVVSIAIYVLCWQMGAFEKITDYLLGIVVAPLGAGLYMYVNLLIFSPMFMGVEETITLERLKTELRLLEKEQE